MPDPSAFPHLRWDYEGPLPAVFTGGYQPNAEVERAKADPAGHAGRLRGDLESLRKMDEVETARRAAASLPEVQGKGFLLRVPDGTDVDALASALGIELVAETEHGLMFAASETLTLERLEAVLRAFELGEKGVGGSNAPNVLEVFARNDDNRKISELLTPAVYANWPLKDDTIYTFDLAIQTAASTRSFDWTRFPRKRKGQTAEELAAEREKIRAEDRVKADEQWAAAAEARMAELETFVDHYKGEFLSGYSNAPPQERRHGIVFPDSVQARVRMSGRGFRDVIECFPHLFEVAFPEDVKFLPGSPEAGGLEGGVKLAAPGADAATVCVIDSGIQENHHWLAAAIDGESSRCFLPGIDPKDVADYVKPRGHGTRVAGAVLYPRAVPKQGEVEPVAWLQNARVLDNDNQLPENLPPEQYLTEVVEYFHSGKRATKIFNHSISEAKPCATHRMCKWGAKMDDLSHRYDVLFIQIVGNVSASEAAAAVLAGQTPPRHLLEEGANVASPGQSLHALTVGSIAHAVITEEGWSSFAKNDQEPSAFTRAGYAPPWTSVKPDVVELGGDRLHEVPPTRVTRTNAACAPELLASTLHGEPAISADDVGTSFAAPKVAHIAAHLQNLFPSSSPQLYRALIVNSARWPAWTENFPNKDEVLRMIGYGLPSLENTTGNSERRVTLITPDAVEISSKQFHLYSIPIPDELRNAALEGKMRVDVALAYTASPRRTRSRRTGYLETWLDWRSINRGEPLDHFRERMQGTRTREYPGLPWKIHQQTDNGDVAETSRDKGSMQKDWAIIDLNEMPGDFAIAVRAHVGWNHKEGLARYCLVVSFESLDLELPVYASIEAVIRAEARAEIEIRGA